MKNIKAALILVVLLACCVPATIGQVVGLSAELDTLFQEVDSSDPLAGLSTYGAYNVYANFTDSADVLILVCGCHCLGDTCHGNRRALWM